MTIDFTKLIKDSDEPKLTKAKLAREMHEQGVYKSVKAAVNAIQYHTSGKAKSIDYLMLAFLCDRFNKESNQIIQ